MDTKDKTFHIVSFPGFSPETDSPEEVLVKSLRAIRKQAKATGAEINWQTLRVQTLEEYDPELDWFRDEGQIQLAISVGVVE